MSPRLSFSGNPVLCPVRVLLPEDSPDNGLVLGIGVSFRVECFFQAGKEVPVSFSPLPVVLPTPEEYRKGRGDLRHHETDTSHRTDHECFHQRQEPSNGQGNHHHFELCTLFHSLTFLHSSYTHSRVSLAT